MPIHIDAYIHTDRHIIPYGNNSTRTYQPLHTGPLPHSTKDAPSSGKLYYTKPKEKKREKKKECTYRDNDTRARLEDPQLLVLAGGGQEAAVPVQRHAVDDVGMAIDHAYGLALVDVPDYDEVVEARAEQDVLGRGVPLDVAHAALVALQLHQPVGQVARQAAVRYVP